MRLLKNINTLISIIVAAELLILARASMIFSKLRKFSVRKKPPKQISAHRTQQHVDVKKQLLSEDLLDAIINNKLELYYQPKLDLKNNTVSSVEALAR